VTCEHVREWLGRSVDNECAAEARQAVETHAATCPSCSRELQALRRLATVIGRANPTPVPADLWGAIEGRLTALERRRRAIVFSFRRLAAAAAVLLVAVGVGLLATHGGWDGARPAQAGTVDFGVLLDGVKMDPDRAFDAFLALYKPEEISPAQAKAYAPGLTFELPDVLPDGFQRVAVYKLHIGDKRGVAARYVRNGELLGFIFHPPILEMRFGERENRSCFIGQVQGHAVDVGEWTLSHLTDPTTCHCVLSKLDRESELPAIMEAIAPGSGAAPQAGHCGS
jgi:hypothetical protein